MATESSKSTNSTTAGILAELWVLYLISLSLVFLRIWVRIRITQKWGFDDWTIIAAQIFLTVCAAFIQIECSNHLGQHIWTLGSEAEAEHFALQVLKWNTFFQIANVLCALFTKYSIALYILRIRDSKRLRWGLGTVMALMTLATIGVIAVLSISCRPLERLWDKSVPGTCLPLTTVYNVAYVHSACTIVIDLCLTCAPMIILWNVKIKKGRKSLIVFLMSLGLIATVCNALRNDFQSGLTAPDMTYAMTQVTVVAILELSSGIIAACVPACMPIFKLRQNNDHSRYYAKYNGSSLVTPKSAALGGFSGQNYNRLDPDDSISLHALTAPSPVATSGRQIV